MKNEIIIINIEVGKVSKDQIPQFIKYLKDCLKRSFKSEDNCPNFVFVPTYNGQYRCTLAGDSEVLRVVTLTDDILDIPVEQIKDLILK